MKKNKTNAIQILIERFVFLITITGMLFMMNGINAQEINHGFKLIEKRFVKEVNAECYYYEHVNSGARLLKIAADDPNKMFGIAFKTIPDSDNGTPHILEHSVLNGSKKFPVKSPFDVLSKGSLKTFLNAMTGKDITFYPVASMNEKDYFNLMNVYLDAVFNPLLYSDPRILKQEGWHYELTAKENPLAYKGVVYGEMKGAFSDPHEELSYQIYKNLFPDNGYGFESGGYPAAIPGLTQESFIGFHRRYYHPENSYILLYGNADLNKELAFIDQEYLSDFKRADRQVVIDDQKPFASMKDITAPYPVMEGSDTLNKTFLTFTLVAGHNTDGALNMALDVIAELLVNQESAPVRLALQKAGIGQDISASVANYKQNVFQITVQNANPGDKTRFYDILMETIGDVIRKGFDKSEIQGVLNRAEFHLREGNHVQKGLVYLMQIYPGWFFAGDPFLGLEYEKPLAEVKKSLTTHYLENILEKYFVNNPHSILLTLVPDPGLDNKRNAVVQEGLDLYKSKLDETAIDSLVTETRDLIDFQKREDTPQALASIPLLTLKDIDPKATWYGVSQLKVSGVPVLQHETFTNDIIYSCLYFDMRTLPQEMIPYASLLSNLLGALSTEKYSYGDLNKAMNINTGALYTTLRTYLENLNDENLIPKFVVVSSAMKDKIGKAYELSAEILNHTQFTDTSRLKTLLVRHQSQLEASKKQEGAGVAATRLNSYFSNSGMFNELTNGLEYYWFITNLTRGFENNSDQIIANLKKAASLLFTKENLVATATCSTKEMEAFGKGLPSVVATLPTEKQVFQTWSLKPQSKNEGILTASKVQYVYEGYNFKKLGYSWNGKMRVLNQVLSRDWLRNRIRVMGGAYGAGSSISPAGTLLFYSYRDPNLKETFKTFSETEDYLARFEADEPVMTRYIIGTIAGMDMPLTNAQRGDQAVNYFFTRRRAEDLQHERDAVLSVKPEDLRGFAKMIGDMTGKHTICVYGNAEKINESKDVFDHLIQIDR